MIGGLEGINCGAKALTHNLFYSSKDSDETMAGGGLIALVAYGAQNVLLSGNPQMTYFYKAFKRYSHFAMENITVPLSGQNELAFDQPIQLRAKVPRYGDLMSDMIFSFTIPDIYSKDIETYTPPLTRTTQWEFQWVRYIGAAIINNVAFFIGGQKIQEFDGSYLLSRALLDQDQDSFSKWRYLVGDSPELTDPANGSYSAGSFSYSPYPTVIRDPSRGAGAQLNRPSIFGRDIHVPLSFWFSESPAQAIPMVGLQYHDCEVQITLNPINQLYTVLDASGNRVNSEYTNISTTEQAQQNNPSYGTADINGQIRYFLTDIGVAPKDLNTFAINPRLQSTFIYLPRDEQQIFATRPLSYLISQVTPFYNPIPGTRQLLDIQAHNPLTRLIFIQRRSDWVNRNDFANFTNWSTYPRAPFIATPTVTPVIQGSGILLTTGQRDMIRGIRVLSDGNEIQEYKTVDFFNRYATYRHTIGIGQDGLPIYSFQLKQAPGQPSGSLNASRIRNFQVDVDVFPLPTNTNYVYDVTIYVENINFVEIVSGMGGLKYVL
jgi:hypothetical protein